MARVSEDFYPLLTASHWAHVANSAYVTLMVVSAVSNSASVLAAQA